MVETTNDGALVLLAEHFPPETIELFPDIWSYLVTGQWPPIVPEFSAYIRLFRALDYLGIENVMTLTSSPIEKPTFLVLEKNLVLLPRDRVQKASCISFRCSGSRTSDIPCSFDAEDFSGTDILKTEHGTMWLGSEAGSLRFQPPETPCFLHIATHKRLKGKVMRAMILRRASHPLTYETGFVAFIQVAPPKQVAKDVSPFALWPSFWLVVSLKKCGETNYTCTAIEISPGGIRALSDGTVALLSNCDNLRKALISIFLAEDGVVQLPPVRVNPVAPEPYRQPEGRSAVKGKGKGGYALGRFTSTQMPENNKLRFPPVRTVHPEGRAPASVWLARKDRHLILLIHAVDGRVALGQLQGPGGRIPLIRNSVRWDVWCRRGHDPRRAFPAPMKRLSLRRQFAVPICNKVLAVLPTAEEIVIVHKMFPKGPPRVWRAPLQHDSASQGNFGFAPILGWSSGSNKGSRKGSWFDSQWHSSASLNLPEDVIGSCRPGVCEVVPKGLEQPDFEFQLWQLQPMDVKPICLHVGSPNRSIPIIGPGAGGKGKGKDIKQIWTSAPGARPVPSTPASAKSSPWLPSVSQWKTSADVRDAVV
eukprot:TRINITY_DN44304_c0_g1_i1.p1 TRINITY_DN44304_c0_g1~~TRINITY_DN44304_c0_g1_i1.p1  ORF type:complete len:659 (+),score=37.12 TRINITY_DN44304_c0_g1_i1:209-1978(+)